MKRKKTNITTASLRSASSKRSRRTVTTINNDKSNIALSSISSKNQKSRNPKSSNTKKVIGSANIRAYFCHGCNKEFRIYSSIQMFINKHLIGNENCVKVFPQCVCKKVFYDKKGLKAHQSRKNSNSECFRQYTHELTNTRFNSSEVAIQPIRKLSYLPSDIPSNLNPLISVQENLMISKKQSIKNQFQSTIKFQNSSIHNMKNIIPSQFKGHATIDPKSLSLKQNVVNQGIYCQPTKEENKIKKKEKSICQQIIDYGDFQSDFNDKNNDESDLSSNSQSEINEEELTNSSDNSSVPNDHKKKKNKYNQIIQDIIENESQKEVDTDSDINDDDCSNHDNEETQTYSSNNNEDTFCPHQQTVIIKNKDHFSNMRELQDKELSNTICDNDYKECLELVSIFLKNNIPLNKIYTETMKWKNKDKKLTSSMMTIKSLLKTAEIRVYGPSIATKSSPTQTNLICPSGRHVSVTSFDVDALILDMLTDKDLMHPSNLIFEDGTVDNPFLVKDTDCYSDFNSSEFYLQTMKQKGVNQENHILVPIQIYMDETTLDAYSKLSLHPLVMTLLIFNRSTRSLSMSWRTLAYIPNFDALFGTKNYSVDMKHNDFHFCLRYLLDGVKTILDFKDGFDWSFQFSCYPGKVYKRNMKFVLGNVLGDAKGANVLCSRYGNNMSSHIARDCDVLTNICDDPYHKCNFHKQKDLDNLNVDQLRELSFRRAKPYNAFSKMDFGANCYGINGACAADPCHMFNKGVVERLPLIFMARLPPKLVKTLDKHVGALITNYGNQSDRDFPNVKVFSKGVSSSAKLRSDQHIARVFVIYLVLLTTDFERIVIHKKGRKDSDDSPRTMITLEEYNQWITVFEETLILHSWVYLDSHPKYAFKGGKNSIACDRLRKYMQTYQSYALRKEGMGLKFLKFHQLLHLWWIIRMFGCLYNVDTARCESHHKKKKIIGRQTQRRIELFDEQTALGEYKFNVFIKAIKKAGIQVPDIFEFTSIENEQKKKNNNAHGSIFLLTFDYVKNQISAKWLSDKMKDKIPEFPNHILDGLFMKFKGYNHGKVGHRIKSIVGFTEMTNNGNIIRACPSYRGEKNWFDWVVVNWEEFGLLEAQCLLFIDFSSIQMESYDVTSSNIEGIDKEHTPLALGKAALVHSIIQEDSKKFHRRALKTSYARNSTEIGSEVDMLTISNKLSKFSEMEDSYQIVETDNIHCSSFVIPYEYKKKEEIYLEGLARCVIVLTPMSCWHKFFIDYYDVNLEREGEKRKDKNISENDERYPYEG